MGTSDRTVESHVRHILNKLALGSRAQIAVWAAQHGIHQLDAVERPRTS
ncbi:MAG TPA: LuxR C-terminal-related transcriptional regulator [bacterium]|nr:LuxR C-terminal-related transcriptional regulator [bacterium]